MKPNTECCCLNILCLPATLQAHSSGGLLYPFTISTSDGIIANAGLFVSNENNAQKQPLHYSVRAEAHGGSAEQYAREDNSAEILMSKLSSTKSISGNGYDGCQRTQTLAMLLSLV